MNRLNVKVIAAISLFAVTTAAFSGCSGFSVPSGLTAAASVSSAQTENTTSQISSKNNAETSKTKETGSANKTEVSFTKDTYDKKKKALAGDVYAIGTTFLGESANEAALDIVLAELGVDEELIKSNPKRLIDCGGNEIWFLCFNDDVTSVSVVLGDEDDGQELYKSDNPGYIFIRCVSSGEVPACTVKVSGAKTGQTSYYPYFIGDQILLPNGGTVLNQCDGIESFVDEYVDNSEETEEEEP